MKKKKIEQANPEVQNNAENTVVIGNAFSETQTDTSSMFTETPPVSADNAEDKKKKKKFLPYLIVAIVAVVLAGVLFLMPTVMIRLGDKSITGGEYEKAAVFYSLCFGTKGSSRRLEAANAIKLIKDGSTKDGINLFLDNGIEVNVKYDLNGGSFINSDRKTSVTLTDKTEFGDWYRARKDYYSFENWELTSYSYAPAYDDTVFDVSLKAVYSLNHYKISYTNLFSDTVENPEEYTYETDTIKLKNPTRTGYTFLYWKGTDINGEATTVTIPQGSHGDRAYIANWEANRYTVTLQPDVECEIENPITVTYDDTYTLPAIEKRGYTHTGWTDGESTYFTGVWQTLKDVSLTPVWEIVNYTLSYDLDGGKLESVNPASYTVESDTFTLHEPTRFGYTFQGWLREGGTQPVKNVVIEKGTIGDAAFAAVWKGNPHTVTLNANGGNVGVGTLNVVFDTAYTLPIPTRAGYTFTGWYNGAAKFSDGTWKRDEDIKLDAAWTANTYKINLNAAGGTVSSSSMTATYDAPFTLPTPTRYGYTFTGWFNGNTKFASSGTWNAVNDVTLVAGWQGNAHTVTLNPEKGSVSATSVNVVFGNSYKLPTPMRKGYTFTGWYNYSTLFAASGTWSKDENITLTATWSVNTYEAVLNAAGGSAGRSSVSAKYESSYSLPTPTRTGYTFLGWYSGSTRMADNGTWLWDSNQTFTAKWQAKQYTVSYDTLGGDMRQTSSTVTYDGAYTLPVPKKKGHSFGGWYDGSTKYSDGTWKHDGNVTLRASWNVNTYKATLEANGGSLSKNTVSCNYGSSYSLPSPSRSGYTFRGWYQGSDRMSASGTWTWDQNLSLTAAWDPNTYTVTLSPNGGTLSKKTVAVTYGEKYSLPIPHKKGYSFNGWYNGRTQTDVNGKWKYAGDVTLTADWEIATYTITLDTSGGSVSQKRITVEYGSSFDLPTPTRSGYRFAGWYYGSDEFSDYGVWEYEDDITLKAKWIAETYTVSLDAAGGSLSSSGFNVEYDESYTLPTPTRDGYEFDGWYNGSSKVASSGKWTIAKNVTLTAKWKVASYKITLNAAGGSVSKKTVTVSYGGSYTLPTPKKDGYTFEGWCTDGGELISSSGTWSYPGDMTLTAVWSGGICEVKLDPNGGYVSEGSVAVICGEAYTLPTPNMEGYVFEGWYNGNKKVPVSGTWQIEKSSVTLKAKWSEAEMDESEA